MHKGYLVRTFNSGYKSVCLFGRGTIYNSDDNVRDPMRLYICRKSMYPTLSDDLVVTGHHGILVDTLTNEQLIMTKKLVNTIYTTEGKYRLFAWIDDRAVPYEKRGYYTVFHIALENEDYYANYGVYANGLLVETAGKRWLNELNYMELI